MQPAPPESLTEEEAHEQAVARASARLREQFTAAMYLFAASAEMILAPWNQSNADLFAYELYSLHAGIPAREMVGTTISVRLMAEVTRCSFCATL